MHLLCILKKAKARFAYFANLVNKEIAMKPGLAVNSLWDQYWASHLIILNESCSAFLQQPLDLSQV